MMWYDEFRVWNNTPPYNCVKSITLSRSPQFGIWIPDLIINNAENPDEITRSRATLLELASDGRTKFFPGGIMKIECSFDLTLFPFDTQKCQINIESWQLQGSLLKFTPDGEGYRMIRVAQLKQWTVIKGDYNLSSVGYSITSMSYAKASFTVILQRKPGFYMLNTIVPSIFISLSELMSFSIPIHCESRLELSFTCILAFVMFQSYVAAELPRSADSYPLLSIFIVVMSICIFLATCFHAILRVIYKFGSSKSEVPEFLQTRLWRAGSDGWRILAKTVDKIIFTIYFLSVIIIPLVFFVVIPLTLSEKKITE